MQNKKLFLIITGPTGVGKTDLVLELAKKISCEIINIDVGQFYTPLSIGTAKPNWQEEPVPHHLFDIINEPKNFTVHDYRKLVIEKMEKIWNKNKLPILVGGSGFYIQSLLFPPEAPNELNSAKNNIEENLWQKLYEIDPARAKNIDKNDPYRIQRALNIWKSTGLKPSQYVPIYEPPGNFLLIILTREREDLYNRINKRVVEMLNMGWLDEVKSLNSNWKAFLKEKKIIGYNDILLYLESNGEEEELIKIIQQKVRNYAKRQITFFKMLTKKIANSELNVKKEDLKAKKIIWFDLTLSDLDLYINQLLKELDI